MKPCSKLLRVVYAVLTKREPYQEGLKEAAVATKGPAAATTVSGS